MKVIKSFLGLVLAALILSTLFGCLNRSAKVENENKTIYKEEAGEKSKKNTEEQAQDAEKKDFYADLKDGNITFLWFISKEQYEKRKAEDPESFDLIWDVIPEFEKKYSGKVNVITSSWTDMLEKLYTMVNAGNAPDITIVSDQNFPVVAAKKVVVPAEQYFDLNNPLWDKSALKGLTYRDKIYAVSTGIRPWTIAYNKTLFEKYGLETPMDYYKQGIWNFDTFAMVGKELTDDINGDGTKDQWGFNGWMNYIQVAIAANGGAFLQDDDSGIKSGLKSSQAQEAMRHIQNWIGPNGFINIAADNSHMDDFKNGKLAMIAWRSWDVREFKNDKFEVGVAPFPTGPSSHGGAIPAIVDGWAIPNGAKNPMGGAAFITMMLHMSKDYDNRKNKEVLGEELYNMTLEINKNVTVVMDTAIVDIWNILWGIREELKDGVPPATVAEKYDPIVNDAISRSIKE